MRRRDLTEMELAAQLGLFAGIVVAYAPRATVRRCAALVIAAPAQIVIDLQPRAPAWVDADDIPEDGDFPTHAIVSARDCEPVKTRAAASIWAFGEQCAQSRQAARAVIAEFTLAGRHRSKPDSPETFPARHARITREAGVTRYQPMRVQETEEWAEKERIRRAKQKLPKPPKQTFRLKKETA